MYARKKSIMQKNNALNPDLSMNTLKRKRSDCDIVVLFIWKKEENLACPTQEEESNILQNLIRFGPFLRKLKTKCKYWLTKIDCIRNILFSSDISLCWNKGGYASL